MCNLNDYKSIYFVGVGGISMSALAKLMKSKGKFVCGCDDVLSDITKKLETFGIPVYLNFCEQALKECELVVYTNAIQQNNKNLVLAKKLKKPILERAEFLGLVCKEYKTVIAVCGTHGKTTTTAMIAHILKDKNPTVHIGGISKDFDDNLLFGSNELFITEACEYNKSFLHINPTYTIVTNIEPDHMDCYKDFNELKSVFHKFICKTSKKVVFNHNFLQFYDDFFANDKIITFSLNDNSTYFATNIKEKNGCYSFVVNTRQTPLAKIKLNVVGLHNVQNALAAIAICLEFGLSISEIAKQLKTFQNVDRRFQVLFNKNVLVISDYAHHPTEIKASIMAAKKLKHRKIICIFEPHTYSRTLTLFKEFLYAFDEADKTIILKTYAAREKPIEGGTGFDLFLALKEKGLDVDYYESTRPLFDKLDKIKEPNDIILFLGAGTINSFAIDYAKRLQNGKKIKKKLPKLS